MTTVLAGRVGDDDPDEPTPTPDPDDPTPGLDEFTITQRESIGTSDPRDRIAGPCFKIFDQAYEPTFRVTSDLDVEPHIVTEWEDVDGSQTSRSKCYLAVPTYAERKAIPEGYFAGPVPVVVGRRRRALKQRRPPSASEVDLIDPRGWRPMNPYSKPFSRRSPSLRSPLRLSY